MVRWAECVFFLIPLSRTQFETEWFAQGQNITSEKSPNLVCRVRATRLQGWLKELCSPEPSPLLFLCLTTPPLFLQTKEGYWTFAKQRSNTVTVLHFARYVRRITTRSKAPSLPFRMSKAPETSICTATYQMYMIRTELHSTVGMCQHLKSNR